MSAVPEETISAAPDVAQAGPDEQSVPGAQPDLGAWLDAILKVAAHYRMECSEETIRLATAWNQGRTLTLAVRQMAKQAGLVMRQVEPDIAKITPWRLPMVVQLRDGQVGVLTAISTENRYSILFSGDAGLVSTLEQGELQVQLDSLVVLRPAREAPDVRVDEYIKPVEKNWLRQIVLQDWRPYRHLMLASLVINVLALAGIFFSRQVYDRVIPAQSYPTLYVLFGGVVVALIFAFVMRLARTHITDVVGKRADLRISDRVFGHALRVRNAARPKATGTFISQLRELEHVREILTSTTVTAVADLPFFLLFCVIFWFIAPPLIWLPFVVFLLLLIPSLLVQGRLRDLAQSSMREASLRNAMLVESVQGMEDIKVLQAEQRFQNQWNHYNAVNAESSLKLRALTQKLSAWTQTVQGAAFAIVVFVGAPLVMDGDLTTGALVAASILSSRMIAPLAGLSQIMNRWQQAKVAMQGLNNVMRLPVDNPEKEKRIHRACLNGNYEINQAVLSYDGETPVLQVGKLVIRAGERIAVLGSNGAGKSSLLQGLAGLLEPMTGSVMLDGANLGHLDPADVRRDVGLVSQNARLFHGTLRENLLLGAPGASDDELEAALQATGAWAFIQRLPAGLDHVVLEGGHGLSGGQRQSLLLARMLIRQPHVLLLDEPTASLDEAAERHLISVLAGMGPERTMVIATHRMSVLGLVQRIIVLANGRVVMDGHKQEILEKLRGKPAATSPRTTRARTEGATE
ncbi:type I secretion system permease/ATPase [Kerstersia gyiorum]|uniref:type I secretion system permease/ATPase n=1 Tax=Kerstersia gyiorum TaxID=206506 RepID=UPI00209E2CB3|nr:type I secretion system permease/ATPase [Kerstersia gyiorum]MCP1636500.1 ATP-binding cassette subfamily C protein LapB [Kerstersia gyiorum]MCP1670247.1 ATP-binding cassette subfamily C protein LapB [Kerstersia gyiorum]MCP1708154.1 ATP-binding cassette subfamily C protein LapB [Kerstersia gyiorum]